MMDLLSVEQGSEECGYVPTVVEISPLRVLFAVLLFWVNGFLSMYLSLGLSRKLIVAAVRCVLQLMVLGWLLNPIFQADRWWWVLVFLAVMLFVSAVEVMSRPSYSYTGMFRHILISIGGSSTIVVAYTMLLVIPWGSSSHWWNPQYLIPIVGMLLGNTISGVSLGLTTILEELAAGRERVEVLLAVGASRYEATKGVVQRSLHVALVPMINQMSVVGIVSIPGMMTGQILAGADPMQAARYQIVILFLIGSTTALGSILTVWLAMCWAVDADHRLRSDRLHLRNRPAGIEVWVISQAMKAIDRMRQFGKRMYSVGRGGIQRSWYSDAPVLRSWAYGRIGRDSFDDPSLGAVIVGSDIGSDDMFSSAGGQPLHVDGDGENPHPFETRGSR